MRDIVIDLKIAETEQRRSLQRRSERAAPQSPHIASPPYRNTALAVRIIASICPTAEDPYHRRSTSFCMVGTVLAPSVARSSAMFQ